MDAREALARLAEVSSQIEAACIFEPSGTVVASTFPSGEATDAFVEKASRLLSNADGLPGEGSSRSLVQLEVALREGSVFVVRDSERAVAAVTKPEPTVGLVFFDLKTCLQSAAAPEGDGLPRPSASRAAPKEAEASESAA
jgi:predicted regulator of Ras-like GTPase activity (Roadblock/LC7/MglB family)